MTIEDMIEATIGHEGGYSNHPDDTGGATMWGITERVARRHGYTGNMHELPREKAVAIYRQEYAIAPGFAAVAEIYPRVGAELFDTGVNMGPKWPSTWLQMCLNALNNQGAFYSDIEEDGDVGPVTLNALKSYRRRRGAEGEEVLLKALNCLQGARYIDLTRARQRNESFAYGWFKRVSL